MGMIMAKSGNAFETCVEELKMGSKFTFTRWGNGEFLCMRFPDPKRKNASGHHFFPDLSEKLQAALRKAIDQKCHDIGLQNMCYKDQDKYVPLWAQALDIVWAFGDVFHYASIEGKLFPLIAQLREMPLVFIGPPYMRAIDKILPSVEEYIEIPLVDCWLDRKRILKELEACKVEGVYCFSASLMADPLITRLHPKPKSWLINFGSLWDVFLNRNTRSYHSKMSGETKRKNLEGK